MVVIHSQRNHVPCLAVSVCCIHEEWPSFKELCCHFCVLNHLSMTAAIEASEHLDMSVCLRTNPTVKITTT